MTIGPNFDRAALLQLKAATLWLVTHGFENAFNHGIDRLQQLMIEHFLVELWARPILSVPEYKEGFRIKCRGFNVDLIITNTALDGYNIYEYWVAKLLSAAWAPYIRQSYFFITRATGLGGERDIILRNAKFLQPDRLGPLAKLAIRADDLETIFRLEPWLFPREYQGSSIEHVRVSIDQKGSYHLME